MFWRLSPAWSHLFSQSLPAPPNAPHPHIGFSEKRTSVRTPYMFNSRRRHHGSWLERLPFRPVPFAFFFPLFTAGRVKDVDRRRRDGDGTGEVLDAAACHRWERQDQTAPLAGFSTRGRWWRDGEAFVWAWKTMRLYFADRFRYRTHNAAGHSVPVGLAANILFSIRNFVGNCCQFELQTVFIFICGMWMCQDMIKVVCCLFILCTYRMKLQNIVGINEYLHASLWSKSLLPFCYILWQISINFWGIFFCYFLSGEVKGPRN